MVRRWASKIPWVIFECKNYTNDPRNPEIAQIAGRLTRRRGLLGFLVCREIKDRDRFLERCREELNNQERYIVGLDDGLLAELVDTRRKEDAQRFDGILSGLVKALVG